MYSLDEILDYGKNRARWDDLKSYYKNHAVIPFVGAGMSAPIFPIWKKALQGILAGYDDKQKTLNELLEMNKYEEAAEFVITILGKARFFNTVRETFHTSLLKNKEDQIASGLLPEVFPNGPVFTTNFDHAIEYCYGKSERVFSNVRKLSNIRFTKAVAEELALKKNHELFKLHGDIDEEDSLVFTEDQYIKTYEYDDFINGLTTLCGSFTFLFLGCSCSGNDRYAQVFRKIMENKTLRNYAFLQRPEKIDSMTDEEYEKLICGKEIYLGEWGVIPIWYPFEDEHHDSVRVLLSSLDDDGENDLGKILKKK